MPKRSRRPIQILPHSQESGLFFAHGEYVADIKPDDGRRIRRKLGKDQVRALKRFDQIVDELGGRG